MKKTAAGLVGLAICFLEPRLFAQAAPLVVAGAGGAPQWNISGTVTDSDGTPASGVRVALIPYYGRDAVTDGRGRYTINVSGSSGSANSMFPLSMYAQDKSRNRSALKRVNADDSIVDLKLQPAVTIAVKLLDGRGRPVTKATGTLLIMEGGTGYALDSRLVADHNGELEAVAAPIGWPVALDIHPAFAAGQKLTPGLSQLKPGRLELPALTLKTADRTVTGMVLDEAGNPATGAQVTASGADQPGSRAHTDAAGRFELENIANGPLVVSATLSTAMASSSVQAGATNIVLRLVNRSSLQRIASAQAVTMTGRVTDSNGVPASGVLVSAFPPVPGVDPVKTDAEGRYTLERRVTIVSGEPNRSTIIARDVARNLIALATVGSETTRDLTLNQGLELSGTICETDGTAIEGAALEISMPDRFSGNANAVARFPQNTVTTDARGKFKILALPQHVNLRFRVTAPDHTLLTFEMASAQAVDEVPAIPLDRLDQPLAGIVVGQDGEPVRDATVQLIDARLTNTTTYTDSRGRFQLMVPQGQLTLRVVYNAMNTGDRSSGAVTRDVTSGDTNIVMKLIPLAAPFIQTTRSAITF